MKKQNYLTSIVLIIMLSVFTYSTGNTKPIDFKSAKKVAEIKLIQSDKAENYSIRENANIFKNNKELILFYIFELAPNGYIVVSADTDIPPVIAYSFTNNYYTQNSDNNILVQLLRADIQLRLDNLCKLPQEIIKNRNLSWENYLKENIDNLTDKGFQQWPPEGTTSTGGWLETNWTQNAPYNNFCPIDPVTGNRSIAGCPAVAMAQIVNYYQTINNTIFTDDDDYYHSYAGRNYWIDDDYPEHDFPSFPQLNVYLDTLVNHWEEQQSLINNDKAAINFACGVAAKQVYTSTASGTFGVNQAYDAYMKFDFSSATLLGQGDTAFLYIALSQNMKDARPAHLAVVTPQWDMGHNVVVDGYNTDEYYHLNFGWGGSYNGWYLLPEEIPYGLTVIEGVVLNIDYPATKINNNYTVNQVDYLKIYPNPVINNYTNIEYTLSETNYVDLKIFNINGQLIRTLINSIQNSGTYNIMWNSKNDKDYSVLPGIYFCSLNTGNDIKVLRFIVLK
ncbi:MAG: thiol protease/hemagglutinin PrtT [Bacteroidales bacterium]|nr:thiol protease/hemagglutinin PrtT [Bacteroidales bacterium]